MAERGWLTDHFEQERPRLRGVAYRMLGSVAEAEDALQEAWLRLSRADTSSVENLSGWLTTVVARVCLNLLQARKARHEEPLNASRLFRRHGRQRDGRLDWERATARRNCAHNGAARRPGARSQSSQPSRQSTSPKPYCFSLFPGVSTSRCRRRPLGLHTRVRVGWRATSTSSCR